MTAVSYCSSWRLFPFTLENLIAKTYKGNNEYTKLKQIRICNHRIALLSFVWRVFYPSQKKGSRLALVSHVEIISYADSSHNELLSLKKSLYIITYFSLHFRKLPSLRIHNESLDLNILRHQRMCLQCMYGLFYRLLHRFKSTQPFFQINSTVSYDIDVLLVNSTLYQFF